MTDIDQGVSQAPEATPSTTIDVAITKAGKGYTVRFVTSDIPQDVYEEALALGLKELSNRGMSKIKTAGLEGTELAKAQQAAKEKADDNVKAIMTSKIKFAGKKAATKESAAVVTEALRLAKNLVKDEIKRAGGKISHYKASEITLAAKELLAQDDTLIEQAKINLAERDKTPVKVNVMSLVKADPELVKKAEAKKASGKKSGTISAKQAGMVKPRAKPSGATAH